MNKEPADYIAEYYETIKDEYPHLSRKQVDNVCRNSFRLIKSEMQKGSLRTIRLRYFGIFVVYKNRALAILSKTIKMFKDEKVNAATLDYINTIVRNYLKREHNEDLSPEEGS